MSLFALTRPAQSQCPPEERGTAGGPQGSGSLCRGLLPARTGPVAGCSETEKTWAGPTKDQLRGPDQEMTLEKQWRLPPLSGYFWTDGELGGRLQWAIQEGQPTVGAA